MPHKECTVPEVLESKVVDPVPQDNNKPPQTGPHMDDRYLYCWSSEEPSPGENID